MDTIEAIERVEYSKWGLYVQMASNDEHPAWTGLRSTARRPGRNRNSIPS